MLRGVFLEELNGDGKTTPTVSDIILQGAQIEREKKKRKRVKNQPWPRFPLHAIGSFRGIFHFLLANFVSLSSALFPGQPLVDNANVCFGLSFATAWSAGQFHSHSEPD